MTDRKRERDNGTPKEDSGYKALLADYETQHAQFNRLRRTLEDKHRQELEELERTKPEHPDKSIRGLYAFLAHASGPVIILEDRFMEELSRHERIAKITDVTITVRVRGKCSGYKGGGTEWDDADLAEGWQPDEITEEDEDGDESLIDPSTTIFDPEELDGDLIERGNDYDEDEHTVDGTITVSGKLIRFRE